MVERQVKEQRLARDGLESRREVHEVGLLGDEGRVQAEGLKPLDQGLEVKSQGVNQTNRETFATCSAPSQGLHEPFHSTPTNPLRQAPPFYS